MLKARAKHGDVLEGPGVGRCLAEEIRNEAGKNSFAISACVDESQSRFTNPRASSTFVQGQLHFGTFSCRTSLIFEMENKYHRACTFFNFTT